MILTGNDADEIFHVKKLLDQLIKIKDLGQLKFFLGLEVARSSKVYFYAKGSTLWSFYSKLSYQLVIQLLLP